MYPSISSAKLSVNVRPSGLSLVLMGISAAGTAPVTSAVLSSAGVQLDGSTAAAAIDVCIASRSYDARMLASLLVRAMFVH